MTARLSPDEARAAFMNRAGELWDDLDSWYQQHPQATFEEMELVLRQLRRSLMGEVIPLILAQGDLGATLDPPDCPKCGVPMAFQGYPDKEVKGLEGEGRIARAYYVCPDCGAGLFPPGPKTPSETGPVE
jgi:ribosomal protein S27AE